MIFPAEGAMVDVCRQNGLPVRVVAGPPSFHVFGKELLRLTPTARARLLAAELVPYAMRLARSLEAARADVVHFNTARGAIMAGLAAHLASLDLVLHVRGTPAIGQTMWTTAQALTGRFILVAHALERYLAPSVRPRARVVYNGVVVPSELPRGDALSVACRLGVPPAWTATDVPIVLALSSLVPFKGLHHLMHAVRLLRDRGIEAHFVLAGVGLGDGYETWLRALPSELGIEDRITFVGFVKEVEPLLVASDVLVLPSVEKERLRIDGQTLEVLGNEGLPRSILEAMALGRAVVATNIAGVREQIEPEKTGLLVEPGDVPGLAEALARVIRDSAFRASAGVAAREVASSRFSVVEAGRGLVAVLREAATARSLPTRLRDAARVVQDSILQG